MIQKDLTQEPKNGRSRMDASMPGSSAEGGKSSSFVDAAKQTAGSLASEAKEQVTSRASSQFDAKKEKAADGLSSVANALRSSQEDLDEVPIVGDYAKKAAQSVDELSQYIQTRTLGQLVADVEGFARREPALFFGGAFAIGMLAGRFLKSSPPKGHLALDDDDSRPAPAVPSYPDLPGLSRSMPSAVKPMTPSSAMPPSTSPSYSATPPKPAYPTSGPSTPLGDAFAVPVPTPKTDTEKKP